MLTRILPCLVLALSLSFASTASAAPADDVNALLKNLGDAFNKGDAKPCAALFAEDGDLISPAGQVAKGRAAVEKTIAGDITGILKGATTKFSTDSVRDLGNGTWLVDGTHEAQNMTGPDGMKMTGKLHVVFVASMSKDKKLQLLAARPYMFLPAPAAAAAPAKPTK